MRLACISGNGEVVDINVAIKQEPLSVRSLLLDSFFSCFESLPDSPGFFNAEHAVRMALFSFQDIGNQERYARSYVLTRSLDPRIEKTPRANLIRLSFQYGGPLALIGILYATIDAHRNVRSRETLDYLMNKSSDESRLELIRRVATFPCSPSLVSWLGRILDKVEPDAQGLACILWWLGAPYVPTDVFLRARLPSLNWGANGELINVPPRMISLVFNEDRLAAAVQGLEFVGFVKSTEAMIELEPNIGCLLRERFHSDMWLPKAAKIIFHALPKYQIGDSYIQQCEALLPHAERVFSHLSGQNLIILLEQIDLNEIVEACLSVSYFRDKSWKTQVLSVATEALTVAEDTTQKPFLQARLDARLCFLSVLFPDMGRKQESQINFSVNDRRSNALSADLAVAMARKSVQVNHLSSALAYLERFNPHAYGSPSTLERARNEQVVLMRAKIFRFEGHFQDAFNILETLPEGVGEVALLRSTVLCELGRYEQAIQVLEESIAASSHTTRIARTKLTLAHAYLFKCMYVWHQDKYLDQISLGRSSNIYEEMIHRWRTNTYYERMDYLSIAIGLAIIQHLSNQVQAALDAWKRALVASMEWLPTGYTDMIIAYSMSDLEMRREGHVLADILASYTRELLAETGRQYHFLGLGSVWPDIIGNWRLAFGKDVIIPLKS